MKVWGALDWNPREMAGGNRARRRRREERDAIGDGEGEEEGGQTSI